MNLLINSDLSCIKLPIPLKSSNFLCADFETTRIEKGIQRFLWGGFTNGLNFYYTNDVNVFINSLHKMDNKIIYFHNLIYDFRFMFNYFFDNNFDVELITTQSGNLLKAVILSKTKIKNHRRVLFDFRDSYALLPSSLKDVSKSLNIHYLKTKININEIENLSEKEVINYLQNDVASLYEALINFQNLFMLNKLNLTIGSITFSNWKKIYNINKFKMKHSLYDFFKKSMYGGRCEVFNMVGYNLYYYDVNSLYPHVMTKYKYPVCNGGHKSCCEGVDYKLIDKKSENKLYIAEVKNINIPSLNIPPLPVRFNNHTIFPSGKIKNGIYNSVDLDLLKRMGGSYDFVKGIEWKETDFIFNNYIDNLYKLKVKSKKEGNTLNYYTSKLLMNALYGKFGQSNEYVKIRKIPDELLNDLLKDNSCNVYDTDFNEFYRVLKKSTKPIQNHISSFILSYARTELYEHMLNIENKGGKIYYCDTDSIISDIVVDYDKYKLGYLDLEHKNFIGYFALPKLYALKLSNDKVLIKGKGLEVERLSFDMIKDFVEKSIAIKNISTRISKINSIMRGFKEPQECYELDRNIEFNVSTFKRVFNGYESKPIEVDV